MNSPTNAHSQPLLPPFHLPDHTSQPLKNHSETLKTLQKPS
jgi:hypothetical protein